MREDLTVSRRSISQTAKAQVTVLGGAIALMWLVFFASWLSGGHLLMLGIIPRTAIGLRGIFLAPFLHGSVAHLLGNTISFLFLGWLVMLRDRNHFLPVTIYSMLASGLTAWLFGAPGSVHIGASGVIFGFLGFLMLAGWYVRSFSSVALSILVTIFWGPLVLGVIPGSAGISWHAHLGGFLGGVLAAREYRSRAVSPS
jgi:membrane associated rhomboid family serine protease